MIITRGKSFIVELDKKKIAKLWYNYQMINKKSDCYISLILKT